MGKEKLSVEETLNLLRETKGYQEGVEHERNRILKHLEEKLRMNYTHVSVEKLIGWLKGGVE